LGGEDVQLLLGLAHVPKLTRCAVWFKGLR